jgi:hypothetical protein
MRLMLDSHPAVAVPPETGFLRNIAKTFAPGPNGTASPPASPAEILRHITTADTWIDFKLDRSTLKDRIENLRPFDVSEASRTFYRLYAARFGKLRYGDKTPGYVFVMEDIQALLPEAHFIHVIRDGRDVALSLREQWFSPGSDMAVQAKFWLRHVRAGRASAPKLNRYLEVRFEDLVLASEDTLRCVCDFLEMEFDATMLRYHERSASRLQEHEGRTLSDGRVLTKSQRFAQQNSTLMPPQGEVVGGWQDRMTPAEVTAFEAVAGDFLQELGYTLRRELRPPG